MEKVFFSFGEIVVSGSRYTRAPKDDPDISGPFSKRRHAFKAFFRRLFKEISSKNRHSLGSAICPSDVLHAVAATFWADADIHFPDRF